MISVYSVAWTILNCSLMALAVKRFRSSTPFLQKYGTWPLILLTVFCVIRMILPSGLFKWQYIIQDRYILPFIQGPYRRYLYFSPLRHFLNKVWNGGILIFNLLYCFSYISVRSTLEANAIPADEYVHEVLKSIDPDCSMQVFISPDIPISITAGILHPKIYLTEYVCRSDDDLYYTILHEYTHYKRNDMLKKLLFNLSSSIMWWNPLIYSLRNEFVQLLEFGCDARLYRHLTTEQEMGYLSTLYHTEEYLNNQKTRLKTDTTGMGLMGKKNSKETISTLRQRFALLVYGQEEGHGPVRSLLIILVCGWMAASYFFLPQPYYMPKLPRQNEMIHSDEITLEETGKNRFVHVNVNAPRHHLHTSFYITKESLVDDSHFNYYVRRKHRRH